MKSGAEVPMAIVFLKEGKDAGEEDIRTFCNGKIADYKIPYKVDIVDEPLPRSLQGKILKYKLRNVYV